MSFILNKIILLPIQYTFMFQVHKVSYFIIILNILISYYVSMYIKIFTYLNLIEKKKLQKNIYPQHVVSTHSCIYLFIVG